jgi:hypothetical protein
MTRRDLLKTVGCGFGMTAFAATTNPLAPKQPHFEPKAKHVIHLFLNGGPSHVDTFDPKPMLTKYNGKPAPSGNLKTERKTGNLLASPFEFRRCGKSGLEVSEIFPKLGECIDDVCVIRSMHTDRPNHEPSLFRMNCGRPLPGQPSMGSWLTYGLGTENQNLPGYVVLCPGLPVIGPQLWTSAYLPGVYQGTYVKNTETDPQKLIQYVRNQNFSASEQRASLDLLGKLNRMEMEREGSDPQFEATIQSMEMAFRMQTEALDAFDINKEPAVTRERYGTGNFAHGCLLARRLVERGVRMVQVYFGEHQPWDTHEDILVHRYLANDSDRPIAALLQDLKASGLLKETVVIIGGEFGRTPAVEVSGLVRVQNGRDHNNQGYSTLIAGGGFKGGFAYGATDDFGFKAIENPLDPNDLQATILNQLGLDHLKLTYRYSGRDFRLTDVGGRVIREILA